MKYFQTAKNIINTFKISKYDPAKIDNAHYKLINEKTIIDKIRTDLKSKKLGTVGIKTYIDPKYHFRIELPYTNEINNVLTNDYGV